MDVVKNKTNIILCFLFLVYSFTIITGLRYNFFSHQNYNDDILYFYYASEKEISENRENLINIDKIDKENYKKNFTDSSENQLLKKIHFRDQVSKNYPLTFFIHYHLRNFINKFSSDRFNQLEINQLMLMLFSFFMSLLPFILLKERIELLICVTTYITLITLFFFFFETKLFKTYNFPLKEIIFIPHGHYLFGEAFRNVLYFYGPILLLYFQIYPQKIIIINIILLFCLLFHISMTCFLFFFIQSFFILRYKSFFSFQNLSFYPVFILAFFNTGLTTFYSEILDKYFLIILILLISIILFLNFKKRINMNIQDIYILKNKLSFKAVMLLFSLIYFAVLSVGYNIQFINTFYNVPILTIISRLYTLCKYSICIFLVYFFVS